VERHARQWPEGGALVHDQIIIFAASAPLRQTATDAGFFAGIDLESLAMDGRGDPSGIPGEVRTRLEAARRAGKKFTVLAGHANDPSVMRLAELLKSNGLPDFQIVLLDLSRATDPVTEVRCAILGIKPEEREECAIPPWRPFPVAVLPNPMRRFVEEASLALRCDPVFLAFPMITICGSLIGTTRRIRLKRTWCEYPILWTVVIADSGSKKSPAFLLVKKPLEDIHKERCQEFEAIRAEYERAKELYEKAKKRAIKDPTCLVGDPPKEPGLERLFVQDVTIEALTPILQKSPRGTILLRDELDGWLSGFQRYSASSDLPHWLSLYNAQSLTVDRKGTGHQYVAKAVVAVNGCIQPGVFKRALTADATEAGLAARLICAMPPRVEITWTEDEVALEVEAIWGRLVQDLLELDYKKNPDGIPEPQTLAMSPEAKGVWVDFYNRHGKRQNGAFGSRAAILAKLEAVVARVALTFAIVERVASRMDDLAPVDQISMEAAVEVVEWCLAERDRIETLLADTTESDKGSFANKILDVITRAGAEGVSRTAINNSFGRHKEAKELGEALGNLAARGLIVRRTEQTQGRSKEVWTRPPAK